ncbi:MAG: serine--tRNA ligase [Bacteroidales bacterium]|nr:serine--tRNA ligase [Bacteroidales bacterium]
MLTISLIREKRDFITERLRIKNFDAAPILDRIIDLDTERRNIQTRSDQMQSDLNRISKEIGTLMKEGKKTEAEAAKEQTYRLKEEIKALNSRLEPLDEELRNEIVRLPNLPHDSVAPGHGADDNVKVREGGRLPELPETAMPHWDLIKKYDIIDFELGIKLTGAGFPVYKGKGARLERALINFFLDEGIKAGYTEMMPPVMVNEDSGFGTGQLPDKEGQMYHVGIDNFYLIPTAEVPVTNIYRDVILNAEDLPVRNVAYTPCFRREAGSWGAHVRGLNRLHQFDKVEIVQIAHPDHSYESLEEMVKHVEGLIAKLDLPYRIMRLSNRLKCRFREKGSKQTRLVHTLNGSALALPRIVAAILENNQTEKGIKVPEVLVPYTGFNIIN